MKKCFYPADIMLPKKDFEKWSVIACDQYTSEPEYWQKVIETVGDTPSALNIILPEAFLEGDIEAKITACNDNMKKFVDGGIFDTYNDSFVYCERKLKNGAVRKGVIGLIDLEDYSYLKGSDSLIRATEETVLERIPPRVNIRKDAILEIPHIMLLIDDPGDKIIGDLSRNKQNFERLYSFKLMQNAGEIEGYRLSDSAAKELQDGFDALRDSSKDGLLFAVGDGNHSLASAKECYNKGYCSRYALAEVVNIHDASLEFEPIYRLVFGVEPEALINEFIDDCGGIYDGEDALKYTFVFGGKEKAVSLQPKTTLAVAMLQKFLDKYISCHSDVKIDYIHGVQSLIQLSNRENCLGILFDGMEKSELFTAVCDDGSLPRKTFSMGCADDKRFYLEARMIK